MNPFQVISMEPSNVIGTLPGNVSLADAVAQTNLYQRFGGANSFVGKTVYHCHFLDHEDQGMIAAFLVADPNSGSSSLFLRGSAVLVIAVSIMAQIVGVFDLW
jgi:Multicopper oxidase